MTVGFSKIYIGLHLSPFVELGSNSCFVRQNRNKPAWILYPKKQFNKTKFKGEINAEFSFLFLL